MKLSVLIMFTAFILSAKGLQCWKCNNAKSDQHCMDIGYKQTCRSNQGSCESEVRENNGIISISKQCKQTMSCLNNQKNNVLECQPGRMNSVCRCCCSFDDCDSYAMHCRNSRRRVRPKPQHCPPLKTPSNGIKDCSRRIETELNSQCRFSCNEGYHLAGARISECIFNLRTNTASFTYPTPTCMHASERFSRIP